MSRDLPPQPPGAPPEGEGTADRSPPGAGKAGAELAGDAAAIAGGGAIVIAGSLGDKGLRMVLNWVLARVLGSADFGVYSFVQTVIATLVGLATLGTDGGIVYFGARYRKAGERERLKGALLACLGVGTLSAAVTSLGLYLVGRHWTVAPDKQVAIGALTIGAASAFLGTVLAVLVGGLVAAKDMRGQAIVNQLGLPALTLLTAAVAMALGTGVHGTLWALAAAYALTLGLGLWWFWGRYGALLADRTVRARAELGPLLRFSIPQSLARSLYQANMRIDIFMLTALATLSDVGIYKIATMLALLGALPVMASTTMFGPVVSELVYGRQLDRLQALLRVVTRWMLILAAPVHLVLILLPDLLLRLFDAEYAAGGQALAVLMLGQAVYVACGPSGTLVTMGGHSMANFVNGLISVALNVGLNAVLIPRWGLTGAAAASALSVSLWSVLRVVEARWLFQATAFDRRNLLVVGAAVGAGLLAALLGQGQEWHLRVGLCAAAVLVFALAVAAGGRTPEDAYVLDRVRGKLPRFLR